MPEEPRKAGSGITVEVKVVAPEKATRNTLKYQGTDSTDQRIPGRLLGDMLVILMNQQAVTGSRTDITKGTTEQDVGSSVGCSSG